MNKDLSREAKAYAVELLWEAVKSEDNDHANFPEDDHPLHHAREALAFVKGGRFPAGNSHRFTHEEFILYMDGKCSHQVSTMGFGFENYCDEPVAEDWSNGIFPEELCCKEHAEEMRESGYRP